jgi:hypothetical protein
MHILSDRKAKFLLGEPQRRSEKVRRPRRRGTEEYNPTNETQKGPVTLGKHTLNIQRGVDADGG